MMKLLRILALVLKLYIVFFISTFIGRIFGAIPLTFLLHSVADIDIELPRLFLAMLVYTWSVSAGIACWFLLPIVMIARKKKWNKWWQVSFIGASLGLCIMLLAFGTNFSIVVRALMPYLLTAGTTGFISAFIFWSIEIRGNSKYQKQD